MILTSAITGHVIASEEKIPDLVLNESLGRAGFIYDFDNRTKSLVKTNIVAPSKDALYIRPIDFESVQGGVRGQIECFKNQRLVIDGKIQLMDRNDPANHLDYLKRNTVFDVEMKIDRSGEISYNKKLQLTDEEGRVHVLDFSELQMVKAGRQIRVNCDKVHFNQDSILLSNANLKIFTAEKISGDIYIKSSRGVKSPLKNEILKEALHGKNAEKVASCTSATHGANGPDGKDGDDADVLSSAGSGSSGGHGAHGGSGCHGKNGEAGLDGIDGASITLQVTNFDFADSLKIESVGSSGGDGGNGGRGGFGGKSGEIKVLVYLPDNEVNISSEEFFKTPRFKNINKVLNSMQLMSAGGLGGSGGLFGSGAAGGHAGNGGQGGDGGSGGVLVGGGSSGRTGLGGYAGEDGNDGRNGAWGLSGYAGRASYQGHKLISVQASDIERVRPQADFNTDLK